jgi:hypothetical protein
MVYQIRYKKCLLIGHFRSQSVKTGDKTPAAGWKRGWPLREAAGSVRGIGQGQSGAGCGASGGRIPPLKKSFTIIQVIQKGRWRYQKRG